MREFGNSIRPNLDHVILSISTAPMRSSIRSDTLLSHVIGRSSLRLRLRYTPLSHSGSLPGWTSLSGGEAVVEGSEWDVIKSLSDHKPAGRSLVQNAPPLHVCWSRQTQNIQNGRGNIHQ